MTLNPSGLPGVIALVLRRCGGTVPGRNGSRHPLHSPELARARSKHADLHSLHEGYSVLLEEVDEPWEEVKKRRERRSKKALRMELVQIAAIAQRMAEDCGVLSEDERF